MGDMVPTCEVMIMNCAACGTEMLGASMSQVPKRQLPVDFRDHLRYCGHVNDRPYCVKCYAKEARR